MKLEELSRILRGIDPAAVLVSKPVLERVVQNVTGLNWVVWWRVPHGHCLPVDRGTLFRNVDQEELYLPPDHLLPETVLLLERPTNEELAEPPREVLARYWRLLFHVSAHRELDQRLAGLTESGLRERVEQLGPAAFEEARNVLVQDGLLPSGADDRSAYVEFAAYFLELLYFAPNLVPVCFPSLPPVAAVEMILRRDIDGGGLFERTRVPGAPNPQPRTDDQSDESHDFFDQLTRQAKRARAAGDTVAAAIIHTRAARVAPVPLTGPAQEAARQDIYALIARLQAALELTDAEAEAWRQVLPTLLDKADQGTRPVEAALLYDLQRACLDYEEKIYTLDVIEWAQSGGKKSVKRELEGQKYVRIPNQLRSASHRLAAARLSDAARQALAGLLRDALNRAEERLRRRFRPTLTEALRDAGLQPTSLPERAALEKTVEELLDRISAAGYLSFADVRDAIARGQIKLPDLAGPQEYLRDPLLRLDRRLATLLDGVYRRAETYTRMLEGTTAFTFGTETGRWLTRNVVLPFGGAFLIAQFVWMLVFDRQAAVAKAAAAQAATTAAVTGVPGVAGEDRLVRALAEPAPSFFGGWNTEWWFHLGWIGLGLFLLAVVRSADLRAALARVGRVTYRTARFVLWEVPLRVWANPIVRAVLATLPVQLAINWVIKPLALSAILWAAFPGLWRAGWPAWVITFAAALAGVNSRLGRATEAALLETLRGAVEGIRSLPALVWWINDVFQELLQALEWVLARAEDWLRLRGRAGWPAVAVRAVAGLIWMPFAFFIRGYTVVLIEPMLNPLKLPLSILFAKFVYPLLLLFPFLLVEDKSATLGYSSPLVGHLAPYLTPWGALVLVMGTLWLLPDACTFLFWEMRENWRVYRANRPAVLRPVHVGPHGETVQGLLHLGFHSGTVPRLFARLRTAEREAARTDNWREARTCRDALRNVEEAVRRFVTRDFVVMLNQSPAWGGPKLGVGRVTLGTNRIRLEFLAEGGGEPAWLEWEDRSGWLVAGWAAPGFLTGLGEGPLRTFTNALAYLYTRAGVGLVREQVRAELPKDVSDFDVGPSGLLVWYGSRESQPLLYDLTDPVDELRPRNPADRKFTRGPTLNATRLVFGRRQLTWADWTAVWRSGEDQQPPPRFGPPEGELTPPPRLPGPPGSNGSAGTHTAPTPPTPEAG
jgi:hypothetical protein